MAGRRVVIVAMPCREIVEIGGALDIFYAANVRLPAGRRYAVDVVSPVTTVATFKPVRARFIRITQTDNAESPVPWSVLNFRVYATAQ